MQARPECQRAMLMDILHDNRVPNEYKKAVRWALCLIDTALQERSDQDTKFEEFLAFASKTVASWPEWRRNCLRHIHSEG